MSETENEFVKPRVGVFLCHCGTNIGGVVDIPAVREYVEGLPYVITAIENKYTCSDVGLTAIKQAISENGLTRVVVAACTPRTHEPLFRRTCAEAGINPFLFQFVNIREQCSWVHRDAPEAATDKAKDLVTMGIARALLLEPLEETSVPVGDTALVIGGGVAGMAAAESFAARKFKVVLIEKTDALGGMVKHAHKLYPSGEMPGTLLDAQLPRIEHNPHITVKTNTELTGLKGFIGNYKAELTTNGTEKMELDTSILVIATGAEPLKPEGLYNYDGEHVMTQWDLEQRFNEDNLNPPKTAVMIQCVGARIPERPYCSKICCVTALKNAMELVEKYGTRVWILHRDMQAWGVDYEQWYARARDLGIRFVKYRVERPPKIEDGTILVWDEFSKMYERIPAELVVLSTPLVAHEDSEALSQLLKVPRDAHGFFLEAHVKLRPVDFATDGIFLAGASRWPCDIPEAISTGLAAASRASIPLQRGEVPVEPITSSVDEDKCIGCGLCEETCPYGAISLVDLGSRRVAKVVSASCKGCGACGAGCPAHAITMRHYTDDQILAEIKALT